MSDGSVIIDTALNDEGLNKGIDKLGGNFNKLKSIAAKAIGAISVGTLVKEGVQYNATIEQLQTSFEVMTGSATKASEVVERLKEIGAKTPFEFTGLAETTQLLMNYGFTADDAMDKMMMLGDISQGSAEKMNRIATAYGQMSSAGKVSLEDVKQMIEAGFNPLREISDSTGESMSSLYDRISKGTLSIDEITASMERSTSAGGKYFQSMEKQSQTLNGQWSTLKDNFNSFIGSVLEPLNIILTNVILPAVNAVLGKLSEKIETVNWDNFANTLKNILAVIIPLTAAFIAYKAAMMISGVINAITTALMSLNPIGLIISLIAALVAAIAYLWTTNEGFRDAITSMWESIKNFFSQTFEAIGKFFTETIPSWINSAIEWFKQLPYNIGKFIGEMLGKIVQFGIDSRNWVTNELPKIINNIIDWFKKLPGNIWNWLKDTVNKIGQWITNMKNMVAQKIPQVINSIINFFKQLPQNMLNIGKNIVEGLWNGIKNAVGWIKQKVGEFAQGILDGMKSALGIHSPSKEFAKLGKFSGLGFGEGFDNSLKSVYKDMQKAVEYENAKLSSNLTSTHEVQIQNEDNRQARLESLDNNKEIVVNSTTKLDSKVIARETNKVNARQKLQYSYA